MSRQWLPAASVVIAHGRQQGEAELHAPAGAEPGGSVPRPWCLWTEVGWGPPRTEAGVRLGPLQGLRGRCLRVVTMNRGERRGPPPPS